MTKTNDIYENFLIPPHLFISKNSKDEKIVEEVLESLTNFQYKPNIFELSQFILKKDSPKAFTDILNSYTFIPIKTIIKSIEKIDINATFDCSLMWPRNKEWSDYIRIDISGIDGGKIEETIKRICGFFPLGVFYENIINESSKEQDLEIQLGYKYSLYLIIDPRKFNIWGVVNEKLLSISDFLCGEELIKKDIFEAIHSTIEEDYLEFVTEAEIEILKWISNFSNDFLSLSLSPSLKPSSIFEIAMKSSDPELYNAICNVIKRTLPLSEITRLSLSGIEISVAQDLNLFELGMFSPIYESLTTLIVKDDDV